MTALPAMASIQGRWAQAALDHGRVDGVSFCYARNCIDQALEIFASFTRDGELVRARRDLDVEQEVRRFDQTPAVSRR